MMGGQEIPNMNFPEASEAERLNYIIDMLSELMVMASQLKSRTLLAVLNAALIEARIQKSESERGF